MKVNPYCSRKGGATMSVKFWPHHGTLDLLLAPILYQTLDRERMRTIHRVACLARKNWSN